MLSTRLMLLRMLVLLVFLLFAGSLAHLQLWRGNELRRQSDNNRLRWVRSIAPRGRILDRHGRPLATCVPALTLWLIPSEVPRSGWDHLLQRAVALGIYPDAAAAHRRLAECRKNLGFQPVALESGIPMSDPRVTRLEEELPFLPGMYLKTEPVRYYPEGALASHVIGFLSEIDAEELAARREQGYRMGDFLGKSGVERACEKVLRGIDGGEQVEVDVSGRKVRTLASVPAHAGGDLTLTIDLEIQRAAEQAMRGRQGAVVVLDPATGDLLAMVSSPSFDLNRRGPRHGEFNKAAWGQYPPGSVFKIVTAAAGLESGILHAGTYYYCDGQYKGIRCWKHAGHGALALTGALAHSCNVYFMKTAEGVGVDALARMARRFGLGQGADIDGVFSARPGVVPDPEWARRVHRRKWEVGETLQMGIGQSALSVTPLQAAGVTAVIANGGKLVAPRLLLNIAGAEQPVRPPVTLGLQPGTLAGIDRGLRQVVESGTARQLDPSLRIAGKTGTAQHGSGNDHAWFAGYAPDDHPAVAVAVIVERGGHGGATAAPIVEAIVRAALGKSTPPALPTAPVDLDAGLRR